MRSKSPVVGVVGSRDFATIEHVGEWVAKLATKHANAVVVSGGARGVDSAAERAARQHGLDVVSFRPYKFDSIYDKTLWSIDTVTHGEVAQAIVVEAHRRINPPCFDTFARAAKERNGWIVAHADHVIAFWDGSSPGTKDSIARAERAGKLSRVVKNEDLVIRELERRLDAREVESVAPDFAFEWFWRKKLPERKGQRCRVVSRGKMNSIIVEFEDGKRVVTSRYAVRPVRRPGVEPMPAATTRAAKERRPRPWEREPEDSAQLTLGRDIPV